MLLWQQSEHDLALEAYYGQARPEVQKKALILSLLLYLLLCAPLFIGSPQKKEPIAVMVQGNARPVLFLPARGGAHGKVSCHSKKESLPSKKEMPPVVKNKKSVKEEKKTSLKKEKTKALPERKGMAEKKVLAKQAPVKEKKQNIIEKQEKQKPTQKPKKETPKKEEPAPTKSVEKSYPVPVTKVEEKVSELPQAEPACIDNHMSEEWGDGDGDAVSKAHRALSYSISRVWNAPHINVKKPLRILIDLTAEGNVKEALIEESSGVRAYDIAARAAVLRAEYPREFWGKIIAIVFGGEES